MSRFWRPEQSLACAIALTPSLADPDAPMVEHCRILNGEDVKKARYDRQRGHGLPTPTVQLKLTLETFDFDYFDWRGTAFVSERLRRIMALDASEARFVEVDMSGSAPLARSKNYQAMEVGLIENISDPERSNYMMFTLTSEAPPALVLNTVAIRPNADVTCSLFYDRFFRHTLFCTDALAMRVLQAGCTGMAFVDPTHSSGSRKRFRTLRGLEQYVDWDPVNKVSILEFVEAID